MSAESDFCKYIYYKKKRKRGGGNRLQGMYGSTYA